MPSRESQGAAVPEDRAAVLTGTLPNSRLNKGPRPTEGCRSTYFWGPGRVYNL